MPNVPQANATAAYFALTFAFTYALQLPGVLAIEGAVPGDPALYMPLAMLGIFGPLVAASTLTWREHGRAGLRELFRGLLAWRVSPLYMFFALLVPGLLLSAVLWLMRLAGYEGAWYFVPAAPRLLVGLVISVAEEVGWRGYALPRLRAKYGSFLGSCILGALWGLWHIPMFAAVHVPASLALVMLLLFVGGSLFFTYLMEKTRGSLFIAVLAHFATHLNNSHAALPAETLPCVVHAVVYAALGFVCMRGAALSLAHLPATGRPGYPGASNAHRQTLSS
jgi:membrane protease YdiL (CAAX protease family)